MPIYDQTYRAYDGAVRRNLRWLTMVKQEVRVLFTARPFVVLLIAAVLHFSFRVFQIVAYDMLSSNPNNPITQALQNVQMMVVSEATFFDYLRIQSPLVFLICLYAGSGMICNDFGDNLMEIYFSKPLTRRDYILGKSMTLVLLGLFLTAVPCCVLVLLHNLLAPGWDTIKETYFLPWSIFWFSLALVVPCALCVLASSAMFKSQRFASISLFMVLFGDLTLGKMLPELLSNNNYYILAFPLAVNRIGEHLFHQRRTLFDLNWQWSALFVVLVSGAALWIIARRIKRAERAA